ncbi:tetratricopeptide repeat protein [Halomonas salipaludis]|nr:tetratricopeptide repeat protein [Halomonas salipaludis]
MIKKDYRSALKYVRHGITNYTILHKTNTAPYIASKNEGVMWLLDIDINSLSELTESLLDCYRGLNDYQSFEYDLERLRGNVSDVRWQRKITYFQVIASLGDNWSEKVGKREVKKLMPLDEENDADIIQLYLHFCSDDLPFKRNLDILDRLISLIEKPSEKLQYTVVKAIKYLCIGDEPESEKLIEQAINDYELTDWSNDNSYGRMQHARAISLLADLQYSAKLKVKSIQEFESLLESHSWTDSGIADIHFEIGKSLFHIKKFEEAIEQYRKSLSIQNSEIVKVFLSQAQIELNYEDAIYTIREVEDNLSGLSESEKLDYIFTYAAIGIAFKQKDMIEKFLGYLNETTVLAPVFEKQKSKLVSEISLLYKTGELEVKSNLLSTLKKLFGFTARYLILQPNIAGLGVNINKIVDDLSESNKKKQSDA